MASIASLVGGGIPDVPPEMCGATRSTTDATPTRAGMFVRWTRAGDCGMGKVRSRGANLAAKS
eukprot:5315915-Pyramimonas_sp.AAC.1